MNVKFTEAYKIQAVQKALTRSNDRNLKDIADSLGVGLSSLSKWIRQAKNHEFEMASETEVKMMSNEKRPQDWTLEERLNVVIKCAALDELAVNALCRENGIYSHHIEQWKTDFVSGKPSPPVVTKPSDVKHLKAENKALKKELNRKDRALAETAALLVLQKKVNAIWGGRRGQLITSDERKDILDLLSEAQTSGARQAKACEIIGVNAKTIQRWCHENNTRDKRQNPSHSPSNKLTDLERQRIINTANEAGYAHLPPSQIVPILAGNGLYIGSIFLSLFSHGRI